MDSRVLSVAFKDVDPLLHYEPAADGLGAGWSTVYLSNKTVDSISGSTQGVGVSVHRANLAGASLSFDFYGSSIQLFGAAHNSTYKVKLDDEKAKEYSETERVLASFDNLALGPHTITLTVDTPEPFLAFYNATFELGFNDHPVEDAALFDDARWSSGGFWWKNVRTYPSLDEQQHIQVTDRQGSTATLTFTGTAISLHGNLMTDHGLYEIALDDEKQVFNGSAAYLIQDVLMFFRAGLDPAVEHTLKLTNLESKYVDFERAVIVSVPTGTSPVSSAPSDTTPESLSTPSPHASPNVGIIAGATIAGVAALLLLVTLIFFLRRRRRYYVADWIQLPESNPSLHLPPQVQHVHRAPTPESIYPNPPPRATEVEMRQAKLQRLGQLHDGDAEKPDTMRTHGLEMTSTPMTYTPSTSTIPPPYR